MPTHRGLRPRLRDSNRPAEEIAVMIRRTVFALSLAWGLNAIAFAELPTDAAARAKVVGQPIELTVQPAEIVLTGPHSVQQLIVTGKYADGTTRDLTAFAEYRVDGSPV